MLFTENELRQEQSKQSSPVGTKKSGYFRVDSSSSGEDPNNGYFNTAYCTSGFFLASSSSTILLAGNLDMKKKWFSIYQTLMCSL
nr:hypothetical protein Iba_chr14fCG8300 [Ipomoea batatas]